MYSWRDHIRNEILYGKLPKISAKIRWRRLKLTGHCQRHPEESVHHLTLWIPKRVNRKRGKPATSFIQQLERDTGVGIEDLKTQMIDRDVWRGVVGRRDELPPT